MYILWNRLSDAIYDECGFVVLRTESEKVP